MKGFRSGIDLLLALQKESNMMSLLCKLCKLPILVGKSGLELFLSQFEAAIDSDFPNYQVHIYLANSYLATKFCHCSEHAPKFIFGNKIDVHLFLNLLPHGLLLADEVV